MQKQNPMLRIWGWGKDEHGRLTCAILGALIGVAMGMLPYFAAAQIIIKMLAGERELSLYLPWLGIGLLGYAARTYFYNMALSIADEAEKCICWDLGAVITIEQLAAQAGVSPSSLKKYFVMVYGCPISKYIRGKRMENACSLLRDTDQSIAYIAEQTGYAGSAMKKSRIWRW